MLSTSFISILYVPIGKPAYVLAGKPAEFASSQTLISFTPIPKASVIERDCEYVPLFKISYIKAE